MTDKTPIFCLMGPTASGKTDLALKLCDAFPMEIISVDSAMVYRGMDIGTAKPSPDILKKYPHHLVDICDPSEPYSAAQFRQDALQAIKKILEAQRVPLLVGGTMLYFKVLQQGLAEMPQADPTIRQAIEEDAKTKGWQYIHDELKKVDPTSAERIHPNDPQRLQRALEVYRMTGKSLTAHFSEQKHNPLPYDFVNIALAPKERANLRERIKQRFAEMLQQGFIEEVRTLYQREDLHPELPAIRAVGYRQAWEYLAGDIDKETMIERVTIATGQLAKRQLTWLRQWPEVHWLDSENNHCLEQLLPLIKEKMPLY